MSDSALNTLITFGQYAAMLFAVLAALCGGIAGLAGQQLSRRSDSTIGAANLRVAKLQEENEKLKLKVNSVIGEPWDPLTARQIDILRQGIEETKYPPTSMLIMYENPFGKELAQSIANAFRAAKWDAQAKSGSGFEDGILVGRGPVSLKLKEALGLVLDPNVIRTPQTSEPEKVLFIGIGARTSKAE